MGESPCRAVAVRRGLSSGVLGVAMLAVGATLSRLAAAIRGRGTLGHKALDVMSGSVLDLAAVIGVLAVLGALVTLLVPALLKSSRTAGWQRWGPLAVCLPLGFALGVLAIIAQEVKSERGAFPTMFDLMEGGSNASFIEGALGYVRYARIWISLLVGAVLVGAAIAFAKRRLKTQGLSPWRRWALGVLLAFGGAVALVQSVAVAQAAVANRFSPAALGDPLTGLVESSADLLRSRDAATPRDLVLKVELPPGDVDVGAGRIGWPPRRPAKPGEPCWPHPHARPLDRAAESKAGPPRAKALLDALEKVSGQLFSAEGPPVAVFLVSLESFRGDDLHALNPLAPRELDPFVNGLFEKAAADAGQGVLASTKTFQAGVRTAQGLGALTCGIGTLPYNLSVIRDLQPFPVRCVTDVLASAGFKGSFFYGSDATFDDMRHFLTEHGLKKVVSQLELPTDLPKGAWGGVTDFGVFDAAATGVAQALEESQAPQLSLVMSLSNHSPYTTPEDLPPEIEARVDGLLGTVSHHADAEDRRRLLTHAYTDLALQRFFEKLEALGIADRSLVLVMADHSTGETYVWGPDTFEPESDEAKTRIPFAVVIPEPFLARARARPALEKALREAQAALSGMPLSQNDVPSLVLALLAAHPQLGALPSEQRWHTLGGQLTSPWFKPAGDPATWIYGINGISELYVLDRQGQRLGGYEDSVFLKTRADRYRVTPRLIPVAATLKAAMESPEACTAVAR